MTTLTPFGFDTDPLTYDEFERDTQIATDAKNGVSFALGDLYVIGERDYPDTYAQAFDDKRIQLVTLQNYARVCKAFPRPRRKWNLSFSHYDVVRKLPEHQQEQLLTKAEMNSWNRDDLRKARHELEGKTKPEKVKGTVMVRDILTFLINDKGFSENDIIDFSAKLTEFETESEAA